MNNSEAQRAKTEAKLQNLYHHVTVFNILIATREQNVQPFVGAGNWKKRISLLATL